MDIRVVLVEVECDKLSHFVLQNWETGCFVGGACAVGHKWKGYGNDDAEVNCTLGNVERVW